MLLPLLLCIIISLLSYIIGGKIRIELTEKNTTTYTGTISQVDITQTGGQSNLHIYTQERRTALYLPLSKSLTETDINALSIGQTITFRVENGQKIDWDKTDYVFIIALRAGETDILTLEEHRNMLVKNENIFKCFCVGILLLLTIIFSWLLSSSIRQYKNK